ncbi:stage III sporulation protein AD [Alicyclobacillus cellulosilyticus]|uniref:Stage III sporulation protein AD n=1 Tax=Alicyclobacillus cellulosilyticus TaxID=1003997 RepID=A0A917K383_9BACL|nr:stage III sporulation protein AD [Alicyclobacillus cellulosilyticus]GGI95976.1 stage III sporulation protein AD [Alicyclobacillus cellulosilyticus]
MHVLQMVGVGMVATVLVALLRPLVPGFAMLVGMLAGVVLLWMVVGGMEPVLATLSALAEAARVDHGFLTTVLKIIGIAYIVEFAAQVARDAQENALAGKIELAGKVGIAVLAIPIVTDVVQALVHLLP